MTIEQNLKNLLGEYSFQLCVLQQQLKEKTDRVTELEKAEKKAK